MERADVSANFNIGTVMPEFSLPSVDGSTISNRYFDGAQASLIIFTCNHCPYVKGTEEQLNLTIKEFLPSGLRVLAINSNDATKYPDDSFENMKKKAREMSIPYPYLYDESQEIAKKFDAACTPECYLFDGRKRLAFHGTINNSPKDPSLATEEYLKAAISQVLEGIKVDPCFVHPIGCSIKWKN